MTPRPTPGRRVLRWTLVALAAVAVVHGAAWGTLLVLQRDHADAVLPNVTVAGTPVGGSDRAELTATVESLAADRLAPPIEVVAGDLQVTTDRAELGVHHDTDTAIAAAWNLGRRGLWTALAEQINARRGVTYRVPLERDLDAARLDAWARDAAAALSRDPRAAELTLGVDADASIRIEAVEPIEGQEVDAEELAATLSDRLVDDPPEPDALRIEAPIARVLPPAVTEADLTAGRAAAELAVSAPVTLVNPAPAADLTLEPDDLARVLEVVRDDDAPTGERLHLDADVAVLADLLGGDGLTALEAGPVEATIELIDDEVVIDGGTLGFEPDLDAIGEAVVELALEEDDREGELRGEVLEPELTREQAEGLGIEQEVSSFTTPLTPGQPRNTNLQRAASLLDGALILPGERFSLNEGIGPRTAERGFVENGFIDDGELISVVGGGVSQMGTTFMNAAWFAGIRLVTFQPHSLYFARYPMGREATLSWNTIDVVVENDSPYGILVASEADDQSVTVSFWSSPWAEVTTETGDPYDVVPGAVRNGFTVDFERTITYPDGTSTTETYTHRYNPEN